MLGRVQQIHSQCKDLCLRAQSQQAGIEIMEAMSEYQDMAYERLYRWIQNESRKFNDDYAELNPLLQFALESLRERAVLYK